MNAISIQNNAPTDEGVSLTRLYALRAVYLIWAVGLAATVWPRFFPVDLSLPAMNHVVNSVLAGLSLSAFLGVRYPLRMLPLMLFEVAWKAVWLITIWLPQWQADSLDVQTVQIFKSVAVVIIFPLVIPWRYVFERYLKAPGDRWK
jgi:hypothetical protein